MSNSSNSDRERLEDLHASKLIFGLTDEESREYDRLLAANRSVPLDALDRTVAKLDLLWCDNQSLPPELATAIRQTANAHVPKKQTAVETVRTKPKPSVANWYPWMITACSLAVSVAARLVLAAE